jgi:chromosome partitioning protein
MYTIAISNEKGGVAKTTTSISLGAALAETGKRVLLVDLDPQANLTLALGFEPTKVSQSMANVFLESAQIAPLILNSSFPNLDLAPSKEEMATSERILPIRLEYEFILKKALGQSRLPYDIVIFDCPPSLGVISLNAYVAANLLIIPTQAEYFSIYALRTLMGWIRRVRSQYNPDLMYRLLLTMYDKRNRIHRVLNDQLHESFQNGVLNTIIETDTKLRESPIAGTPILSHAPNSRAALQYRNLAQEIGEYVKEANLQPA